MTRQRVKGILLAVMLLIVSAFMIPNEQHTDLASEQLHDVYLYEHLDVHALPLARDVSHPGYAMYDVDGVVMTVAKQFPHTVYRISTSSDTVQTAKQIAIGATLEDVILAYGENGKKQRSDQVDYMMSYFDHERHTVLHFYMVNDAVTHINLEVRDFDE